MANVRRIYVEKRPGLDVEARNLLEDLRRYLGLAHLSELRLFHRYDVEDLSLEAFGLSKNTIFSEPNQDYLYEESLPVLDDYTIFGVEPLPGQFDQRADSASQCIQLLTHLERPPIRTAKIFALRGDIREDDLRAVQNYCVNPVETRLCRMEKPETLLEPLDIPPDVKTIESFTLYEQEDLDALHEELGLAMHPDDLRFCQTYFSDTEKRDPTLTEIKVIDTYWSDHCRHTTFLTRLEEITIGGGNTRPAIEEALALYLSTREEVYGEDSDWNVSLMDLATIGAKTIKKRGGLPDLDESDEINACAIRVNAIVNGVEEPWLVQFKNETHNHPTEIEPFGGAATCLGGAIRDPLSGRAYVYQAMRLTGSGNPLTPFDETLPGKLPQRQITQKAAQGFSSYGNQIGLATGQVTELYHPDYVAKRFEVGALIGASPLSHVRRGTPVPGDVILLLGGRTGRDGIGGATGSSKSHTETSIETAGVEVQKGNAPTERKLQRLFRNPAVSQVIKKCNDFGAGGVSVAVGELASGLHIDLDAITKKYEGLDGTDLAISESQERMAVVVDEKDMAGFIAAAEKENLECVKVATVTGDDILTMVWRKKPIVRIQRSFLDSNGVTQSQKIVIQATNLNEDHRGRIPQLLQGLPLREALLQNLRRLSVTGQHGLIERFDSTVGGGTVLMPLGGSTQLVTEEAMVAKLPLLQGDTDAATAMSYGFNPYHSKQSPFYGSLFSVLESLSKLAAVGADPLSARLSFQEYFERLRNDPLRWGKPAAALLGALLAQLHLNIPSIGGKDSMSGSFDDLDVPPTLVSFAVAVTGAKNTLSASFKGVNHQVILVSIPLGDWGLPKWEDLKHLYATIYQLAQKGSILAASVVKEGGIAACIMRMSLGNLIGFKGELGLDSPSLLFRPQTGDLVLELSEDADESLLTLLPHQLLGQTLRNQRVMIGSADLSLDVINEAYTQPLATVFPTKVAHPPMYKVGNLYQKRNGNRPRAKRSMPRVLIPAFPGTNCEYDTERVFEEAGARTRILVINNLSGSHIEESIRTFAEALEQSQILAIPGGFSLGDEPDGSGKFIATTLRNPRIRDAVMDLLRRDGLILGICNGFQALIKTGLLPYGEIREIQEWDPTLTYNSLGRHISRMATVRITSVLSPWLMDNAAGDIHTVPLSHGEGRLVAIPDTMDQLFQNGQVATQYVDSWGNPTMEMPMNPNGSYCAVEGLTSPDGRVFGRMGHPERLIHNALINVPGNKTYHMFASGVRYFTD